MLRVTIEILPYGDETRSRVLGFVDISNVGGDSAVGEYACEFSDGTAVAIKGHKRANGFWYLLTRVLLAHSARLRKVRKASG